jgi:cell division transport system ATP-binding protein
MITFEQVSKRYGGRLALDAVSWRMDEGECVVFLGPSGAGKTTVLRLITHEIQPSSGTVAVGTFRTGRLTRPQRALLRRTLGIIYEDFRLLSDRTVFENVALAVRIIGRFAESEITPRVRQALEAVGLHSLESAFPFELSAGEKQRTAIARAIVNRPAVVLADEPTGALEAQSARDVLQLLQTIHHEGAAVLLVTTREEVAAALPGRVLRLMDGKLIEGAPLRPANAPAAPAQPTTPAIALAQAPPASAAPGSAPAPSPAPASEPPASVAPAPPTPAPESAAPAAASAS